MRVYTGGTFDLLHAGHVEFLNRCAKIGQLTVSLNTDQFVAEYKGEPPTIPYEERKQLLTALRSVDKVIENTDGADSKPAILKAKADIIAIGSDWYKYDSPNDYLGQLSISWEWLYENGIALTFVPRVTPNSSTDVKNRIKK